MTRIGTLITSLALAGCFGSTPTAQHYELAVAPPAPMARAAPYPHTLWVHRFGTAIAYDRPELVYRPRAHELRFYDYRLWVAKPGPMLGEAVATYIAARGIFANVTTRASERAPQYELQGEVLAIEEIDREAAGAAAARWDARLAMRLVLTSVDDGSVVWDHAFDVTRAVARRHPTDIVAMLAVILGDELAAMLPGLDAAVARHVDARPDPTATAVPAEP